MYKKIQTNKHFLLKNYVVYRTTYVLGPTPIKRKKNISHQFSKAYLETNILQKFEIIVSGHNISSNLLLFSPFLKKSMYVVQSSTIRSSTYLVANQTHHIANNISFFSHFLSLLL